MTLLENVMAQIAEMEMMGKRARALRCDHDSLTALIYETKMPEIALKGARFFGLIIELDSKPNFDVVA